ncbi:MAG: alpha/beta fold hydrolase [Actinobacteria bacterium]|nr:alpha/beta fold hydrolase [Actinomycetota bacterium]
MSVENFIRAENRALERFGIEAERRLVDVPALGGQAHVLVAGDGPPVMMVIGAGPPAAIWAPLMAELRRFTLYVVDLPGMGRTDPVRYTTATVRSTAVDFLGQVLDGLGLDRPPFVAQSVGGLWATWFALERPDRVPALVLVAAPALILGNAAPLPLRLISVPALGPILMRLQPPSPKQIDRMAALAGEDFTAVPELRELWVALERLPTYGPALCQLINANERLRGARPELALTAEQLAQILQPVQFIWGEGDLFGSPALGERAAEIVPNAELHIVPGGHAPWLNHAEQIGSLAAPFLRKHSVAP